MTGTASPRRPLGRNLVFPTVAMAAVAGAALAWVALDWTLQARRLASEVALIRTANTLAYELDQLSSDAQRAVIYYQSQPGPTARAAVAGAEAQAVRAVERMARLTLPPPGHALWQELVQVREKRLTFQHDLLNAFAAGGPRDRRIALARWDLASERETALLADLGVYHVKRLDRITGEAEARRRRALGALAVTLLAAAIAVTLVAMRVNRRVALPLLAMSATADRIAREKSALLVEGGERQDEIGVLARALNQMTADLVLANERLAAALATRDEFLSIASHELRTPLTSLKLQLDGALRRLEGSGQPPPAWMESAQRQTRRLEGLIGQLLDVTRIRAGRLTLDLADTDLAAVARAAAERIAPEMERAGNPLHLALATDVTGRWDGGRLDQVVTNLLSNALKYAPGSPVSLRVSAVEGRASLEVEDGGAGIPPELRPRMFDPFQRGGTPRAMGGLGLGLFIVRQIVEAHGGDVHVEDAPGGGARFVIGLPRSGRPASATPLEAVVQE